MTLEDRPIRILLVDDSPALLWGLGKLIQGEFPRMTLIGTARTDGEAVVYAHLRPDVIVVDLDLDGYSSIEIIPTLKQRSGGAVLVHTGLTDRRLHEDAILFGAMDVVEKDVPAATLLDAIEGAHAGECRYFDTGIIEPPSAARIESAAAGFERLTTAERRLIVDLVGYFRMPPSTACPMPPVLARIVSLYDRLGLRNRLELSRFATAHALVGSGSESSVE